MAYFANGTAGIDFEQRYCSRCVHMGPEDGPGCPVWAAHLLFSYQLCNAKEDPGKIILDMLIPGECAMFVPARRLNATKRHEDDRAELERLVARCSEILKEAKGL